LSRTHVVVLKAPSLFTEGIAARLGQHPDEIELEVVDSRDAVRLASTMSNPPDVILFEAGDENVERHCLLVDLLTAAPGIKVVRLDASQDRMLVFTGEQRSINEPRELLRFVLELT
jgi:DNA-binding NarL/FixJ family response regulator